MYAYIYEFYANSRQKTWGEASMGTCVSISNIQFTHVPQRDGRKKSKMQTGPKLVLKKHFIIPKIINFIPIGNEFGIKSFSNLFQTNCKPKYSKC